MKYNASIDGLRALAVIPVILYHAGFKMFSGGYVGVDVFFVISGYLITSILINELEAGTFTILGFYERRSRRILPALFVMMFVCLPFAWFLLLPDELKSFSQSLIATSTFVSNILFWKTSGYFDSATELKPLIHTWSLTVEEQYYLFFPLFLMVTWRWSKKYIVSLLAVVFIVSFISAHLLSVTHPWFAFYMLPSRVWELLIGAFIAFYCANNNKKYNQKIEQLGSLLGLLLIIYAVFVYDSKTPFPSAYTLVPTVGAALIIIFVNPDTIVGRLLSSKPFVSIGLISYSAYLWHQPMFAFIKVSSEDEPSLYLMSLLALFSFVFGYLSWRYVEKPFRNKLTFSRDKVFFYGLLLSVFFIAIGIAGNAGKIKTFWQVQNPNLINSTTSITNNKFRDCTEELKKYGNADCKVSGEGNRVIVVWGDSHAETLSKNIPLIDGVRLYVISHNGCPPIIGVRRFDGLGNSNRCNNLKTLTNYANFIESLHPESIVLVSRWTLYLNGWQRNGKLLPNHHFLLDADNEDVINTPEIRQAVLEKKLRDTVNLFSKHSNVILLSQPPDYAQYSESNLKRKNFSKPNSELIKWHKGELELLESLKNSSPKVKILDSKGLFCKDDYCHTRNDGFLLYADDNHLTVGAAEKQWEIILKQLSELSMMPKTDLSTDLRDN